MSGHPLIPVLQVTSNPRVNADYQPDFDAVLTQPSALWIEELLGLVVETLARRYVPRFSASGDMYSGLPTLYFYFIPGFLYQ